MEDKKTLKIFFLVWGVFFLLTLFGFWYSGYTSWTNGILYFGIALICYILLFQTMVIGILIVSVKDKQKEKKINTRNN